MSVVCTFVNVSPLTRQEQLGSLREHGHLGYSSMTGAGEVHIHSMTRWPSSVGNLKPLGFVTSG